MRSIVSLSAALVTVAGCGDPFDHARADPRLTAHLASPSAPERALVDWIGAEDLRAVCFLDEFTTPRYALDYMASIGSTPAGSPLNGAEGKVPEGALGVLVIRAESATIALVPQAYLFDPGVCHGPDAVLRRSSEDPSRWVIVGERLPWL